MVQFHLLASPPGMTPGFAIFSFVGGLFPAPRHAERDNSPRSGLFGHALHSHVNEKQRDFLCTKSRYNIYFYAKPYHIYKPSRNRFAIVYFANVTVKLYDKKKTFIRLTVKKETADQKARASV